MAEHHDVAALVLSSEQASDMIGRRLAAAFGPTVPISVEELTTICVRLMRLTQIARKYHGMIVEGAATPDDLTKLTFDIGAARAMLDAILDRAVAFRRSTDPQPPTGDTPELLA